MSATTRIAVPGTGLASVLLLFSTAVWEADGPTVSVAPDKGTVGSTLVIQGADFGAKRGKVFLEWHEDGHRRRIRLRVHKGDWTPAAIACRIRKVRRTQGPVTCDLRIVQRGGRRGRLLIPGVFDLAPPEISDAPLVGEEGDEISISGRFFGARPGSIRFDWREDASSHEVRARPGQWNMDPETAISKIVTTVPSGLPHGTTCHIVVTTRLGASERLFFHGEHPETLPPTAKIRFPPPFSITEERRITVGGTAADLTGVASVTVNGVPATSTDAFATWHAEIPLSHGRNSILVQTADLWGNTDDLADTAVIESVGPSPRRPEDTSIDAAAHLALVLCHEGIYILDLPQGTRPYVLDNQVGGGPNLTSPASAFIDSAHERVIVFDSFFEALLSVDLNTGDRTIVSGPSRGEGPPLGYLHETELDPRGNRALALASPGKLLAVDLTSGDRTLISTDAPGSAITLGPDTNRVFLVSGSGSLSVVDLDTGQREVVSDASKGAGPSLEEPRDVAWDPIRQLCYVPDRKLRAILSVDPTNGDRAILVDSLLAPRVCEPLSLSFDAANDLALIVALEYTSERLLTCLAACDMATGSCSPFPFDVAGAGPRLGAGTDILVDSANLRAIVLDPVAKTVVSVDTTTGDRAVLSGPSTGTGPLFDFPLGIAADATGQTLLVADYRLQAILGIDLASGNRTLVSGDSTGEGRAFREPIAIDYDKVNGRAIVLDRSYGSARLLAVDTKTGDRAELLITSEDRSALVGARDIALGQQADSVIAVFRQAVGRIDLATGAFSLLSGHDRGLGPSFESLAAIAIDEGAGRAVVVDEQIPAVFAVDLETGDRTRMCSSLFAAPTAAAIDSSNDLALILDSDARAVLCIDLGTGEAVVLSK